MRLRNFLLGIVFLSLWFALNAQAQIDIRGQISGKVLDEYGNGVRRVNVLCMNLTTLETQSSMTSGFGYFSFDDLPIGDVYLIGVDSRRFFFQFPYQSVNLDAAEKWLTFYARPMMFSSSKEP